MVLSTVPDTESRRRRLFFIPARHSHCLGSNSLRTASFARPPHRPPVQRQFAAELFSACAHIRGIQQGCHGAVLRLVPRALPPRSASSPIAGRIEPSTLCGGGVDACCRSVAQLRVFSRVWRQLMHAASVGGEPRLFERQCAGGTQSPGLANSSKALLTAFVVTNC